MSFPCVEEIFLLVEILTPLFSDTIDFFLITPEVVNIDVEKKNYLLSVRSYVLQL